LCAGAAVQERALEGHSWFFEAYKQLEGGRPWDVGEYLGIVIPLRSQDTAIQPGTKIWREFGLAKPVTCVFVSMKEEDEDAPENCFRVCGKHMTTYAGLILLKVFKSNV